ncbi:MAG: hypothetical protein RIG82_05905 [Phycisphaeraceae bacterium]
MLESLRQAWKNTRRGGRLRRSNRWRRRLALSLLAIILALTTAAAWMLHPANLTPSITSALRNTLGINIRIQRASIDLTSMTLHIEQIQLLNTTPQDKLDTAAVVPLALVRPNWIGLITGSNPIDTVLLIRPTLRIVENQADGELNLARLLRLAQKQRDTQTTPGQQSAREPVDLPTVYLRAAEIHFASRDTQGNVTELAQYPLTGHMKPRGSTGYQFILKQATRTSRPGFILTGRFNAEEPSINLDLERLDLEQGIRYALPRNARTWWDSLDPQGDVTRVSLGVRQLQDTWQVNAQLILNQAAITLPFTDQRPPRMTGVTGRLAINNNQPSIELTGNIEGIQYAIEATAQSLSPDASFTMTAKTDPFVVPDRPDLIFALPPQARDLYNNLEPAGTLAIETTLNRATPNGPITYRGTIHAIDASIRYFRFAYPVRNVRGTVKFSPEAVELIGLTGNGVTGAFIAIDGRIAPVGLDPAVNINVTINDLPIDHLLFEALNDGSDQAVQMFFDREQYARLQSEGILDSPPLEPDQIIPPTLGGTIDADFTLRRPVGPDQPAITTTVIDTTGLRALQRHWPYPITSQRGTFTVSNNYVRIDDLHVTGPTGGSGVINAQLQREEETGRLDGDVVITQAQLPVDPYLLATIPGTARNIVTNLAPTGNLEGNATVSLKMDGTASFDVNANVLSASLTPHGGDYRILDVNGSFSVTNEQLTIPAMTGDHAGSTLAASGTINWGDPAGPAIIADVNATNLTIEPGLIHLIPPDTTLRPAVETLFDTHKPTGTTHAHLSVRRQPVSDDPGISLELTPSRLAFDFNDLRFDSSNLTGTATINTSIITLNQITAATSDATLTLHGTSSHNTDTANLDISASGGAIDTSIRALLPPGAVRFIDNFQLTGGWSVNATLNRTPQANQPHPITTFKGRIDLEKAAFNPGIIITDAYGSVDLAIRADNTSDWPLIDLTAVIARLQATKRTVEYAALQLSNTKNRERIDIPMLRGALYDGSISANGSIELTGSTEYRFNLDIVNTDIDRFAEPKDPAPPTDAQRAWVQQALAAKPDDFESLTAPPPIPASANPDNFSASLSLAGITGQPDSRMGRGELQAVKINLLDQPLSLAVLRAFNLTLPNRRPLDTATMRYLIDGDHVRFDGVQFTAPDFAIIGAGNMNYVTREIDLALYSRSRTGSTLGLNRVVDTLRDQIAAIRVTGTVEEPQTSVSFFPGLRDSLQSTLGLSSVPPFLDRVFNDPLP